MLVKPLPIQVVYHACVYVCVWYLQSISVNTIHTHLHIWYLQRYLHMCII